MIPRCFLLLLAALTLGSVGCAGGWRNGGPPGSNHAEAPATTKSTGQNANAAATTFVWKGGGSQVFLAGTFNEWKPDAEPMAKQADGSFTLSKALAPGRYQYKFVIDGTWKEDPTAPESVDDGQGGKNSVLVVGGGPGASGAAASSGAGASPATSAQGKPPAIAADGVTFTFAGAANTVALAGDFNAWAVNADPMTRQADGTWSLSKKLAPGTYAYKFLVNGTVWKHDEANPETRDDPYGGKNSVVTVK